MILPDVSSYGRECRVCRAQGKRRRMRRHLRHLHELEPGDRFRVYRADGGPVRELVHVGPGRCDATTSVKPEPVSFEANGERVEFTRPSRSATKPLSPYTEVVPC